MVMVMATAAAHRLRQILDVGKLTAGRRVGEIGGELTQLAGRRRIAILRGRLRCALQIGSDLLRHLLILGGVRLLELLQRTHQLSKW